MELKPHYKQTEVGVVPDDWLVVPFAEFLEFRNGVNAEKQAYGQGVPFINVLEVITKTHLHVGDIPGRVVLSSNVADSFVVRRGDLLFNRTSETQEEVGLSSVYLDDDQVVFGGFVIRGRPNRSVLDAVYSGYAFRAPVVRAQITARGQGAIRANIGQSDLRTVFAPLPPLLEQRAIAAALGDVDALLGALTQLITKKRNIKQAAMQQLLTGKTRLPGFSGEWELSVVGREFDIQLGKMLDAEKNRGIPKPYIGNKAVQWNHIIIDYLPMVPLSDSDLERFRLIPGDLLVCEGGEVGRAGVWEGPIEECYFQKALHRLRPLRGFNPYLMVEFLQHWSDGGLLANSVSQTSIAHLTREKFAEVPILVPQADEQRAIIKVLSDMNAEIVALEQRLSKTRALKQGMMQELLAGKTRFVSATEATTA